MKGWNLPTVHKNEQLYGQTLPQPFIVGTHARVFIWLALGFAVWKLFSLLYSFKGKSLWMPRTNFFRSFLLINPVVLYYTEYKWSITVKQVTLIFLIHCYGLRLKEPSSGVKGKAVPLQAWSSPEGSRKLSFPDFMTTAQDGGKVVSLTHLPPLPPGNTPGTHFC